MGPCLGKAFAFFVFFVLNILHSGGMVGISYRLFRQEDEQLHLYHSARQRKRNQSTVHAYTRDLAQSGVKHR